MVFNPRTFIPRTYQFKLQSEAQISCGVWESAAPITPGSEGDEYGIGASRQKFCQ
jgi:hypothetical protein